MEEMFNNPKIKSVRGLRGDVKKWYIVLVGMHHEPGLGRGIGPDHNFWSKLPLFVLLLFVPEAFKTCKNRIKLLNSCGLPFTLCKLPMIGGWLSLQTFNNF